MLKFNSHLKDIENGVDLVRSVIDNAYSDLEIEHN
jgi:hypothetical protein